MKRVSLSGSLRENVGKKDAKGLRKQGKVPCVLYGGKDQLHVAIEEKDLKKLVYTPDVYQIDLDVNGDKRSVIVQEMQFHPITDEILHADFLQLFDDKLVNVKLPVRISGNSPGILAGGKMSQNFRRLTVRGLPNAMPEDITIDISGLNIGDSVRVRDIELDGLTLMDAAPAVVVAVKMARGANTSAEEEEEAEATEGAEETPAAE